MSVIVTNDRLYEIRLEAAQKYVTHEDLSGIKRELPEAKSSGWKSGWRPSSTGRSRATGRGEVRAQ